MGFLIDPIPDSPANIMGIIWQTERRIANEILGVIGLIESTKNSQSNCNIHDRMIICLFM